MPFVYSTGPLENSVPNRSLTAAVQALNNGVDSSVTVLWLAFALDGAKRLVDSATVTVKPLRAAFQFLNLAEAAQYEIEAQVSGPSAPETMLSVFGVDAGGGLNPAHRLVHSELTLIETPVDEPVPAEAD